MFSNRFFILFRWLVWAIGSFLVAAAACAAERVALVIGNSAYRSDPLKNPANDARDMAEKLRGLGFVVTHLEDVGFRQMISAFQEFSRSAEKYDVRLLYYAGHGLQFKDSNYLIPIDADLKTETDISRQAVLFDDLAERLAQIKGGVNIFILDACRHNPFSNLFAYGASGRRIQLRGLATPEPNIGLAPPKQAGVGSFIAFSTQPGHIALDNPSERNSTYAKHLLKHVDATDLRIEDLFQRVRRGVREETQGRQVPWEQTSLEQPFCLKSSGRVGCERL